MQCGIRDWTDQRKDVSGKAGEIQINFIVQLTVLYQG